NVPVVTMTARQERRSPVARTMADTRRVASRLSVSISETSPAIMSRLGQVLSNRCTSIAYLYLSAWARGPQTAGPLERLSMRNWMPVLSMARPINPPRASISRTICPLASPPIAGLQDIWPILSGSMLTSATRAPRRDAAHAASAPAWPPPITMMSKSAVKAALGKEQGLYGESQGKNRQVAARLTPSPGTPGEGRGEGDFHWTLSVQRWTFNVENR